MPETTQNRDIREVWDFRLSSAAPTLYNLPGENWRVEIHDKGEDNEPLATYDTGIPSTPGDNWNTEGMDACYAWLRSVRDEYALPGIEIRKPVVAMINEANAEAQKLVDARTASSISPAASAADRLTGALERHLREANAAIKKASEEMHEQLNTLEA